MLLNISLDSVISPTVRAHMLDLTLRCPDNLRRPQLLNVVFDLFAYEVIGHRVQQNLISLLYFLNQNFLLLKKLVTLFFPNGCNYLLQWIIIAFDLAQLRLLRLRLI